MIKQRVLEAYSDGSALSIIAESFDITQQEIIDVLLSYKEESRFKKTFTNEFKNMIAQRDINGVPRVHIARELELNVNTIKKACEKFGQAIKEKSLNDLAYTKIIGEFQLDICPSCGSRKNNLVDENITFCLSCDSEHEYYYGYVKKINFEYIEE